MKKTNKISLISIIFAVVVAIGISTPIYIATKNAKSDVAKAAYELPISGNQYVTELDYSNYAIDSVSDIYDTKLQSQIKKQLETLKNESKATVENPLIVSNPFLTNNNGVYINFKSDKDVKNVKYTVETAGASDFSATLVNDGAANDFESQLIGLIAGKKNNVTLTVPIVTAQRKRQILNIHQRSQIAVCKQNLT